MKFLKNIHIFLMNVIGFKRYKEYVDIIKLEKVNGRLRSELQVALNQIELYKSGKPMQTRTGLTIISKRKEMYKIIQD